MPNNDAMTYGDEMLTEWRDKLRRAQEAMRSNADKNGILIEVAAQHPLRDGMYPNDEFSARLDRAYEMYEELIESGDEPVRIYVPGSVHMCDGVVDAVSLSAAGCEYLKRKGVRESDLFGEDANASYKGDAGVYNSSDECYVACQLFDDLGYREMRCVCSPVQLLRKALSYIQFGHLPLMYSVPLDEMFHSYVDEALLYIPRLIADGNGLQGDSQEADRLRQERKPV